MPVPFGLRNCLLAAMTVAWVSLCGAVCAGPSRASVDLSAPTDNPSSVAPWKAQWPDLRYLSAVEISRDDQRQIDALVRQSAVIPYSDTTRYISIHKVLRDKATGNRFFVFTSASLADVDIVYAVDKDGNVLDRYTLSTWR